MLLEDLRARFERAGFTVSVRDDVTAEAASWYTGYRLGGLKKRREKGLSPPYRVLGCGVRYPIVGLMQFVDECTHNKAA